MARARDLPGRDLRPHPYAQMIASFDCIHYLTDSRLGWKAARPRRDHFDGRFESSIETRTLAVKRFQRLHLGGPGARCTGLAIAGAR